MPTPYNATANTPSISPTNPLGSGSNGPYGLVGAPAARATPALNKNSNADTAKDKSIFLEFIVFLTQISGYIIPNDIYVSSFIK